MKKNIFQNIKLKFVNSYFVIHNRLENIIYKQIALYWCMRERVTTNFHKSARKSLENWSADSQWNCQTLHSF